MRVLRYWSSRLRGFGWPLLIAVVLVSGGALIRRFRLPKAPAFPPPQSLKTIRLTEVFPKLKPFDKPVLVSPFPDKSRRLLIAEQNGRVFWTTDAPDASTANLLLDIRERVDQENFYTGIFGIAFHPKVRSNGRVFFHYTSAKHKGPVLSEFQIDRRLRKIDPATEKILLEFRQPFGNHDGGNVEFGPDGFLYVSIGHGGGGGDQYNDSQELGSLMGKILRIDVDRTDPGSAYAIPADNPFVGVDGAREEIWALGFRNVWRFSFDRPTGTLWAGDVGHDLWDEVDIVVRGGNYGWNYYEGPQQMKDAHETLRFVEPAISHPHEEVSSLIGGYVYRGEKFGFLRGGYVYGDFVTGKIFVAFQEKGRWIPSLVARTHELASWNENPEELVKNRHITTFGEDNNGEILLATYDGRIFRIQ